MTCTMQDNVTKMNSCLEGGSKRCHTDIGYLTSGLALRVCDLDYFQHLKHASIIMSLHSMRSLGSVPSHE